MPVPIREWGLLIDAINQLKTDWINSQKINYKYTWSNFKLPLESNKPTKIIDLPDGNYQILINNKSNNYIYLYLGDDGDEKLTIDNSGWELKPGYGIKIENTGCTLWAISQSNSDIIVTVHSEKPNSKEEVTIALNVVLKVGTGTLLGRDIPLSQFAGIYSDWEQILRDTVDSDQGITGHKLAYLQSFQPGNTYDFNLQVDPAFTDFDPAKNNPIAVHLVDFNLAQTAMTAAVAAMRGLAASSLDDTVKQMIGYAKNGAWVKNLPPTGGAFSITPGNHQSILHFGAHTPGSTDACVITNFDETTNTFTLGGY